MTKPGSPRRPLRVPAPRIARVPQVVAPARVIKLPEDAEESRKARWEAFRAHRAASYLEFICFEWLTIKKHLFEGVDFIFQNPLFGGRTQFGGFVLDFYFPALGLAWFIQGLRFHFTKPTDRARDLLAVAMVAGRGILVVQLFEDDLLQREEYTLASAYRGVQISRRAG